jgi:hypothetical protein
MKASPSDIDRYFGPVLGQHPKRSRLGHGSFLTFDFGQAFKQNHRFQYEWHLWIQHVDWQLLRKRQQIANSESKRQVIQTAIARLETKVLKQVIHDPRARETRFVFSGDSSDAELICKAYSDARDDEYSWALYTPDMHVLLADNVGQLHYIRSDVSEPVPSMTAQ